MYTVEDDLPAFGQYGDPAFVFRCHWCGLDRIQKGLRGTFCSFRCVATKNHSRTLGMFCILAFAVYVFVPFLLITNYLANGSTLDDNTFNLLNRATSNAAASRTMSMAFAGASSYSFK